MTPEALAKKTALSNAQLVAVAERLAALVGGVADEVAALRAIKPSTRRPAESMLREREALVAVLEGIARRLDQATPAPPPADAGAGPTPGRSRRPAAAPATATE